jgi:membrane-associated phospholipid phosphatase
MHDWHRLALMLLALASMLLYFPLNKGRARYYFDSPLDRRIPFLPMFIYPYLSFFPFIVVGLAAALPLPVAPQMYLALIVGVLAASLTRYFVRGGVHRPGIRGSALTLRLVRWLYQSDDRAHTFPSSHVLISMTMSYYLALAFPGFAAVIWAVGCTIAVSTVFVKQHFVFDVLGGLAFALIAVQVAGLLLPLS